MRMTVVAPSLNVEVPVNYRVQVTNLSSIDCTTTLRIAQLYSVTDCVYQIISQKELATCLGVVMFKELKLL